MVMHIQQPELVARTVGGMYRTDPHRHMKTTAAKQGRQKETHQ